MSMRDDVMEIKKELEEVREESFAMELLRDYKKANKRMFIIWVITFISFLGLLGYTIWLLNDISVVESTEVIQENNDGYNNYVGNDGDITNGEAKD